MAEREAKFALFGLASKINLDVGPFINQVVAASRLIRNARSNATCFGFT